MFHQKHKHYDYDLIVIGSGSGGSVGAHYARSIGKKVALFEHGTIGGECPNFACVPTKALLHAGEVYEIAKDSKLFGVNISQLSVNYHAVKKWKDTVVSRTGAAHGEESFREDGIHVFREKAVFISPHEVEAGGKIYSAAKFIIATGSKVFIPPITGIEESGYITFEQAVDLTSPPESILIFGGGPVGCEFAQIFSTFGSKVTLVNRSEKILGKEDTEVSDLIQALFENQGIRVLTNTSLIKIEKKGDHKVVHLQKAGKEYFELFDHILIATGKIPVLNFAPEKAKITVEKGRLKLNNYLQTSVPHIYAAGDIAGPYLFTHTGYYQSYIAAHNAFSNKKLKPDYKVVPRCVFTSPEVASVGVSEKEALEKGIKIKKGIMAIAELGRSNTSNSFDGFVKVITDKKGLIIGGSIVSARAGEMIHELALAIKFKIKADDIADMIHAYPTYSEGIKIACGNVE
jgi:pyruvate/2-oxoglutarate dehydrogenase complex dihydrolipoamide dehydrogenase (E3) component